MIVKLPTGTGTCAVDLRGLRVRPLVPTAPPASRDPAGLVAAAVDAPLDIPPLTELCRDRRRATVVVPDATRNAQLDRNLPVVLGRLRAGGIDGENVTVLVACGTHPPVGKLGQQGDTDGK